MNRKQFPTSPDGFVNSTRNQLRDEMKVHTGTRNLLYPYQRYNQQLVPGWDYAFEFDRLPIPIVESNFLYGRSPLVRYWSAKVLEKYAKLTTLSLRDIAEVKREIVTKKGFSIEPTLRRLMASHHMARKILYDIGRRQILGQRLIDIGDLKNTLDVWNVTNTYQLTDMQVSLIENALPPHNYTNIFEVFYYASGLQQPSGADFR